MQGPPNNEILNECLIEKHAHSHGAASLPYCVCYYALVRCSKQNEYTVERAAYLGNKGCGAVGMHAFKQVMHVVLERVACGSSIQASEVSM